MPKLDLGTLAGVMTRGGAIIDQLRCGNTTQTVMRLRKIAEDPARVSALLNDLDALEQHLRVLKFSELDVV